MKNRRLTKHSLFALPVAAALALTACGGGGSSTDQNQDSTGSSESGHATGSSAQTTYHMLPVLLDAPPQVDANDPMALANTPPTRVTIPRALANVDTRGLTVEDIKHGRMRTQSVSPNVDKTSIGVFSPAQIRAAYGFPMLPSNPLTKLTAEIAAQQGGGQTIYIIVFGHDPNIDAELAAFNTRFGLPGCTSRTIPRDVALPIPAASITDGCTLSVVYSSYDGTTTSLTPPVDPKWQMETAVDVEWAHASAPRARIVLIESSSNDIYYLAGAIKRANAMGPGIVSMSFGTWEFGDPRLNAAVNAPGMTYVAASGDSAANVFWPAVAPTVLAVGGTTTSFTGDGTRSERGWTLSSGGTSAYEPVPSYQSAWVPGMGTQTHRSVPDVAFNADTWTSAQWTATIPASDPSGQVTWSGTGGTSIGAPQWAGMLAVANAMRAQSGQAALGLPHASLYGLSHVPATYATAFADIREGSNGNGSCPSCGASVGYDRMTGLGTPNVGALLNFLSPASNPIPGSTNLLANGSFENDDVPANWWSAIANGDLAGWTNATGAVELQRRDYGWTGAKGTATWMELDGYGNSHDVVGQTVPNLVPGKKYTLSYWVSARPLTTAATNAYAVTWNGVTVDTGAPEGSALSVPAWQQRTVTVTAQGVADTLSFVETGTDDSFGTLLDEVVLQDQRVVNGDFEDNALGTSYGWYMDANLAGWSNSAGYIEVQRRDNGGYGANGSPSWIELDAAGASHDEVSQTIPGLTAGQTYTLSYWVSARPGYTAASNLYALIWDGTVIDVGAPEGRGLSTPTWQQRTLSVTAKGGKDTLTFVELGTDDGVGTLLDQVVLMQ